MMTKENCKTMQSKLVVDQRHTVSVSEITAMAKTILAGAGCDPDTAALVANHLVEANLNGVESHGVMRLMQYVEQIESGYIKGDGRPTLHQNERKAWIVDGHQGFGIPALQMATEKGIEVAKTQGLSAVAVINSCHTGRLGEFAETGAEAGCLTICIGGGGRLEWPQVAPYGGAKGRLPTNPYAFGIPGGERGPVVLDFATSKIAGGWIYAAKSAGVDLPADTVIDADGHPTLNPDDYHNGGSILPMGGPKGYGLALLAELVGEALLGPITTEMNWLLLCIDTGLYREAGAFQAAAEAILHDMRTCPPAAGFTRVEVPGERERDLYQQNKEIGIPIPATDMGTNSSLVAQNKSNIRREPWLTKPKPSKSHLKEIGF